MARHRRAPAASRFTRAAARPCSARCRVPSPRGQHSCPDDHCALGGHHSLTSGTGRPRLTPLLGQRLPVRLAGGPDPQHDRPDPGQRLQEQLELADLDPGHLQPHTLRGPERRALVQRPPGRIGTAGRQFHVPGRRVGDQLAADGSGRADRGDGDRGQRAGDGELDRADEQRRQRDHQLHGDALRRHDGPDADDGDRQPARDLRHGDRADERHHLHLHRHGDQRRSAPARPPPPPTPSHRPRRRRRARRPGCRRPRATGRRR